MGDSNKGEINFLSGDLHAADCLYHQKCSINFRTGKSKPQDFCSPPAEKKRKLCGRPVNEIQQCA